MKPADVSTVRAPEVSVIVPSYNAASTIATCLAALSEQRTDLPFEIIVVDSGSDGAADIVATHFPEVRLLRFPERKFAGHARNLAIAEARGRLLAFTDADCVPSPDWIEAIRAAHRRSDSVIGGVVTNANPESYVGRAYYFTEFNNWLPDARAGLVDDIAGCCWSMKRSAYSRFGPFLEGTYSSDTAFHWRMAADGQRPYLDPTIRVAHRNPTGWQGTVAHESFHGRCFAQVRVAERGFSRGRSLLHAMASPALPLVLFARAFRNASGTSRQVRSFLSAAPLVFLAMVGWSHGEMLGYFSGAFRRDS
jgi:glycosyltransferase involved in cell wall biosynthesis